MNATSPWWVPVVAAFGASLITIIGTFGLFQWQRWRDNRAGTRANKLAAYSELHARAFSFVRRVGSLGLAKQLRSGIGEGIVVSLGQRKSADIFELDYADAGIQNVNALDFIASAQQPHTVRSPGVCAEPFGVNWVRRLGVSKVRRGIRMGVGGRDEKAIAHPGDECSSQLLMVSTDLTIRLRHKPDDRSLCCQGNRRH